MKTNQQGFNLIMILPVLIVVIVMGVLTAYILRAYKDKDSSGDTSQVTQGQVNSASAIRDRTRRDHVIHFASNLFYTSLIEKRPIELNQQGFEVIARTGSQEAAVDPLTNQQYVYNADQTAMNVGEVTFRLNATCDDKISGSQKSGLIVDGSTKSVAIAVKLESGGYACESNL